MNPLVTMTTTYCLITTFHNNLTEQTNIANHILQEIKNMEICLLLDSFICISRSEFVSNI